LKIKGGMIFLHSDKDLIVKVIRAEIERKKRVNILRRQLLEQEEQGEMCDCDRVTEIITELSIIDPPIE